MTFLVERGSSLTVTLREGKTTETTEVCQENTYAVRWASRVMARMDRLHSGWLACTDDLAHKNMALCREVEDSRKGWEHSKAHAHAATSALENCLLEKSVLYQRIVDVHERLRQKTAEAERAWKVVDEITTGVIPGFCGVDDVTRRMTSLSTNGEDSADGCKTCTELRHAVRQLQMEVGKLDIQKFILQRGASIFDDVDEEGTPTWHPYIAGRSDSRGDADVTKSLNPPAVCTEE